MTELRIGDAERERAVAELADHYAEGRLTRDEHAERLDAAWSARTSADVELLFDDLPRARPVAPPVTRAAGPRRPRAFLLPFAVLMVVLSVATGSPFWVAIIAAWWFAGARACRYRSSGGRISASRG